MDSYQTGLTSLLQQSGIRFWVPVYQRPYAWGARQCEDLWRDIMRAGRLDHPHFAGTVFCSTEHDDGEGRRTMAVIDGQQRLATVSILLATLAEHLRAHADENGAQGAALRTAIGRCLYLEGKPRLELGGADNPAYLDLLKRCAPTDCDKDADRNGRGREGGCCSAPACETESANGTADACATDDAAANANGAADARAAESVNDAANACATESAENAEDASEGRVLENHRVFASLMAHEGFDVDVLLNGLRKLEVIYAVLGTDDQPQLVFESLNSKGMPLTNADLIRNALLVSTDFDEQARLYERYWQPLETLFDNDPDRITAAVHAWLAVRFRRAHVHGEDEVYHVFKMYLEEQPNVDAEELLSGLLSFCRQFAGSAGMRKRSGSDARRWIEHDADQLVSKRHLFGD